jgi:hypothetical protein
VEQQSDLRGRCIRQQSTLQLAYEAYAQKLQELKQQPVDTVAEEELVALRTCLEEFLVSVSDFHGKLNDYSQKLQEQREQVLQLAQKQEELNSLDSQRRTVLDEQLIAFNEALRAAIGRTLKDYCQKYVAVGGKLGGEPQQQIDELTHKAEESELSILSLSWWRELFSTKRRDQRRERNRLVRWAKSIDQYWSAWLATGQFEQYQQEVLPNLEGYFTRCLCIDKQVKRELLGLCDDYVRQGGRLENVGDGRIGELSRKYEKTGFVTRFLERRDLMRRYRREERNRLAEEAQKILVAQQRRFEKEWLRMSQAQRAYLGERDKMQKDIRQVEGRLASSQVKVQKSCATLQTVLKQQPTVSQQVQITSEPEAIVQSASNRPVLAY